MLDSIFVNGKSRFFWTRELNQPISGSYLNIREKNFNTRVKNYNTFGTNLKYYFFYHISATSSITRPYRISKISPKLKLTKRSTYKTIKSPIILHFKRSPLPRRKNIQTMSTANPPNKRQHHKLNPHSLRDFRALTSNFTIRSLRRQQKPPFSRCGSSSLLHRRHYNRQRSKNRNRSRL